MRPFVVLTLFLTACTGDTGRAATGAYCADEAGDSGTGTACPVPAFLSDEFSGCLLGSPLSYESADGAEVIVASGDGEVAGIAAETGRVGGAPLRRVRRSLGVPQSSEPGALARRAR